jgi:hypothetical protein
MQTVAEINRLLTYIYTHENAWQLVQMPLVKMKDIIENIYYEHVLVPKLKNTFTLHKTAYERCIMLILWVLGGNAILSFDKS